jgi:hypothetical protein
MAITMDWDNRVVISTSSITDLPAFKDTIRSLEEGETGVLYPPVITYKRLDLGGGGYFHAVDFVNGYELRFEGTGPFVITGNLNCPIVDTGVQVERTTSAAFATTSTEGGGGGLTVEQAEMLALIRSLVTELHRVQGLDASNPAVHTASSITTGDIELELTGDGIASRTVTRKP